MNEYKDKKIIETFLNHHCCCLKPSEPEYEKGAEELLAEENLLKLIEKSFIGLSRSGGVSLHQSYVLDLWGTTEDQKKALEFDTDKMWQEVKNEWIEFISSSGFGGLNFLGINSFKYYLPAYLRWYLLRSYISEAVPGCIGHLDTNNTRDDLRITKFETLGLSQKNAVAQFLIHVEKFEDHPGATSALNSYWKPYLL